MPHLWKFRTRSGNSTASFTLCTTLGIVYVGDSFDYPLYVDSDMHNSSPFIDHRHPSLICLIRTYAKLLIKVLSWFANIHQIDQDFWWNCLWTKIVTTNPLARSHCKVECSRQDWVMIFETWDGNLRTLSTRYWYEALSPDTISPIVGMIENEYASYLHILTFMKS